MLALLSAAASVGEWVMRAYGLLFVAIGAAFLYWSGRGFLAYERGIRAAWTEPLACALGLVAAVLCFWLGVRIGRGKLTLGRTRGVSPELEATMDAVLELEKTDPVAATQLLDSYFMREAAAAERRRDELRQRAPHDVGAAVELRKLLQASLATNALARKEFGRETKVLDQIDADDRSLQDELVQLDRTIHGLRLKAGN